MSILAQAAKRTKQRRESENSPVARFFGGVALIALGVLIFLAVALKMTGDLFSGLRLVSGALCGSMAWLLPLLLIPGGILVMATIQRPVQLRSFVLCCVFFLLAATLANVITFVPGSPPQPITQWASSSDYLAALSNVWIGGMAGKPVGGGALGMVVSWPLWKLVGTVLSALLLIAGMVAVLVFLFRVNPKQLTAWMQQRLDALSARREERTAERERAQIEAEREAAEKLRRQQPETETPQPAVTGFGVRTQQQPAPQQPQAPVYGFGPAAGEADDSYQLPLNVASAPRTDSGKKASLRQTLGKIFSHDEREQPARKPAAPAPAESAAPMRPMPAAAGGSVVRSAPFRPMTTMPAASPQPLPFEMPASPEMDEPFVNPMTREAEPAIPDDEPPFDVDEPAPAPVVPAAPPTARRRRTAAQPAPAPEAAPRRARRTESAVSDNVVPVVEGKPGDWQPQLRLAAVPEGQETLGERQRAEQATLAPEVPYAYPPLHLLKPEPERTDIDPEEDRQRAQTLEAILKSFHVDATVVNITHGPVVSRFELSLAPGIQVSRVTRLENDIALGMAAKSVRIEAPVPGKTVVGVELPNVDVATVTLREILESTAMQKHKSDPLIVALGRDIAGAPVLCNLAKMPHLLIAGATGSGKSVCINTIINSLIYRRSPKEVRMILIDPKMVELQCYNGIAHLLLPVVSNPKKASAALGWAVDEMMRRYNAFKEKKVRNLDGYNAALAPDEEPMPRIVIIIDELADLMMVCKRDVEERICRIAQLARAAGMHLVVATQRPSVDVITGLIKANIPSRIAFKVSSYVDSRTVLDHNGAEQLLGYGDMLYQPTGQFTPTRVQGCFLSDDEVNRVCDYVRAACPAQYDPDIIEQLEQAVESEDNEDTMPDFNMDEPSSGTSDEELIYRAAELAIQEQQISTSMVQRQLRLGYARAGRIMDELFKLGIVTAKDGIKPRKCLIDREQLDQMKAAGQLKVR